MVSEPPRCTCPTRKGNPFVMIKIAKFGGSSVADAEHFKKIRAIVEADHLRCPADISWCEDFLFNLEYMARCRLVTAIHTPVYYYLKRSDSLVSTQATLRKTIATKRATFAEYKELYQQLDLYEEHKAKVYRYLLSAATDGMVGPLAPTLARHEAGQERSSDKKPDTCG